MTTTTLTRARLAYIEEREDRDRLASDLAGDRAFTPLQWRQAIDAAGGYARARWLLAHMSARGVLWTPELLVVAHATAVLLELGPRPAAAIPPT